VKRKLFDIEAYWSETNFNFNREWDTKEGRENNLKRIENAEDPTEIMPVLMRMDDGFSLPHVLKYK